jgi:hypothetical protein
MGAEIFMARSAGVTGENAVFFAVPRAKWGLSIITGGAEEMVLGIVLGMVLGIVAGDVATAPGALAQGELPYGIRTISPL